MRPFIQGRSRLRRIAPLLISVGLVLAVGAVGLVASANASGRALDIHREDREFLQSQLAQLTDQFLLFAAKEVFDFGAARDWNLHQDDPADRERLRALTETSALFAHGAALVGITAEPLNAFAHEPGLPEATDPGFTPLIRALLRGEPGLSSVMLVDSAPVVGVGVPIMDGEQPRAILVAFFRAETGPLQIYNERLLIGETGRGYMIDSVGTVVASGHPEAVGRPMLPSPAVEALGERREGFVEFERDGVRMVASYSPVDFGGWGVLTEQTAAEFFGPIRSGGFRAALALVAVLVVAASGLMVLNHKRKEALARAYEYKGQLLANTTHELKTPLTAVRGAAMTLGMRWREMDPGQVDQFLSIVHRRCDDLGKLVDRILLGARLEAGQEIELRPAPGDLGGVLRRMRAEFAVASPKHQLTLEVPDLLWAEFDERALDQILGLLIENAIKYSPDGGRVSIEGVRHGDVIEVGVRDEGIGVTEDDLERIFEPYYRVSREDTQAYAGVGLGLPIARHLARRQGGDIHVAPAGERGTIFTVTLRATDPPAAEATELLAVEG